MYEQKNPFQELLQLQREKEESFAEESAKPLGERDNDKLRRLNDELEHIREQIDGFEK